MNYFKIILPIALSAVLFGCQEDNIDLANDQTSADISSDISESNSRNSISSEVWEEIIEDYSECIDDYKDFVQSGNFSANRNDELMVGINALQITLDDANSRGELTVVQINQFSKLKQKLSLIRVGGS
jgi:hypothetical protein